MEKEHIYYDVILKMNTVCQLFSEVITKSRPINNSDGELLQAKIDEANNIILETIGMLRSLTIINP